MMYVRRLRKNRCKRHSVAKAFVFVFRFIWFQFKKRGVKFGLVAANPRVEGVMVSAPPEISYYYKHEVEPDSPEAHMLDILKTPQSWV